MGEFCAKLNCCANALHDIAAVAASIRLSPSQALPAEAVAATTPSQRRSYAQRADAAQAQLPRFTGVFLGGTGFGIAPPGRRGVKQAA
jgi:hypothetical protein